MPISSFAAAWRRLARDLARPHRRAPDPLDAAACRDLGIDRSELDSFAAEAAGAADRTRRRVAAAPACSHAGSHVQCLPWRSFHSTETVMPKFVIERAIPGIGALTPAELQAASQKSCGVLQELGPQVQWDHSYVTGDKLYCVYVAHDEALVREHARRAGFPASSVARVLSIIDPTTAEA